MISGQPCLGCGSQRVVHADSLRGGPLGPLLVVVGDDGRIRLVGREAERLLGVSSEEHRGRPLEEADAVLKREVRRLPLRDGRWLLELHESPRARA